jgi:hypothetical protein
MKKKLNIAGVINELSEGSVFFRDRKPLTPPPVGTETPAQQKDDTPITRETENAVSREPEKPRTDPAGQPESEQTQQTRTPLRPLRPVGALRLVRRRIRRWPYELYEDQVEALRTVALEDKLEGGQGSASAIVREAIDQWLARRKRREE